MNAESVRPAVSEAVGVRKPLIGTPPSQVVVARQPISGPDQRVFGYELLFRKGTENKALIEGAMGLVLNCVVSYEQARWADLNSLQVNPAQIQAAYVHSLDWSRQLVSDLTN